jgi:signal transduction histidine kinase
MSAAHPTATPAPRPPDRFARRGVRTLGVGVALSTLFSLVFSQRFMPTLIYTLGITMCCWFLIDGGRLVATRWQRRGDAPATGAQRSGWPGWGTMIWVLALGTPLGYSAGIALGNLVTGNSSPGLLDVNPRQAMSMILISLIPGIAVTYFFWSRGQLAASEARAQAALRQAAENQLKLLESQLEPHMLFNTLANLRVLIGMDPPRAQAMLDRLIAFLRATLEASRNGMHPLSAEFARIGDYLELMQVRMGDRLHVQLDLPAELAAVPVPPLLLQPLVENAIKHGLESHVQGGRLRVRAMREGDALVLQVRDTGAGLAAPAGDGTRFGLQQVRSRLDALHGDQASLELAAATDAEGGTLATIRLPLGMT